MEHAGALQMADRHVLFKHTVKQLASKCGLIASFMAKPRIDEVGSSCHIHVSLRASDGDTPIDWEEGAPQHMSKEFASFVAGQLVGARELALLWAPTVNSYKRFTPGAFAGTTVAVGDDNRSCGFRLVGVGDAFRVENRIPGADANPYLAYAATIAAGLAGIDIGLPAPSVYDGDAYADPDLEVMPSTMHEALALFERSNIARKAFGTDVHSHLAAFAAGELSRFEHRAVTDWETRRYFTRI
jgi:glutamine synthetase